MARADPFHTFRFRVEIDQVQHGAFARLKGMVREVKFETRREGGVNDFEHKLRTMASYPNLVLERGLADAYLWDWHEKVIEGQPVERRTVTIALNNEEGDEVWRWLVEGAYPVKWTGTDLDASSGAVLFESVELAHHGIRKG